MTIEMVKSLLLSKSHISFAYAAKNTKLSELLGELYSYYPQQLELIPLSFSSGHVQSVMSFFQLPSLFLLYSKIVNKYDLICSSQGDIEIGSKVLIAAWLARIKVVCYIPGDFTPSDQGLPFSSIRDQFAKILYKIPNAYISISDSFVSGLCNKSGKSEKSVYLLENIITHQNPKKTISKLQYPMKMLVVGDVCHRKNQTFLLDWLELNPHYHCHLTIVGSGKLMQHITQRVSTSLLLKDRVSLLGWRDDVQQIMLSCDLLVIPSSIEGVPLVMLEAAASKLPILATDLYGMGDFLPHEMRFKLNDYTDFSQKLNYLIDNPLLCLQLINRNYRRVIARNDLKAFNQQVCNIFDSLSNN